LQAEEQLENNNQPIETGFVFFDGKYIEAPYILERRDLAVYINGIQITKEMEWPIVNKYAFDHDPGIPPNITKEMTLDELFSLKEPKRNIRYIAAKQWYLFSHFSYEEAFEKTITYFEDLPNIKSLTKIPGKGWVIESYVGEKRNILFGGSEMRQMNAVWGPEGSGPSPQSEIIEKVNELALMYRDCLQKDNFIFIFTEHRKLFFSDRQGFKRIREMLDIMNTSKSQEEKMNELISIGLLPRSDKQLSKYFVSHYSISTQLENRLKTLKELLIKKYGEDILTPLQRDEDLKKSQSSNSGSYETKEGRDCAYSPDSRQLYAWCGYTYDTSFSDFLETEITKVGNYIKEQDFIVSYNIYTDNTLDDDCEDCTYDNLKNMKYADFLYIAAHGESSNEWNGLRFINLETEDQILNWCNNDNLITPEQITYNSTPYWTAVAGSDWASEYWNDMLTSSKAISILSCCYSYENGWVDACAGGVAFGYGGDITAEHVEEQNEELLKRMNGVWGGASFRKAGDAYDNMSVCYDQFSISPVGAEITLCPATEERNPDNGDIVSSNGTGNFLVDTYCHGYESANDALTFNTFGNVTIDNVSWNDDFKVNGVEYEWNGTGDFMVYVSVHTDKFKSWGSTPYYHHLDFDRVTPNNEGTMQYYFSHEDNGDFNTATSVNIPHNNEYSILFEDDVDFYEINLDSYSTYKMYTESIDSSFLDPEFYLFNSAHNQIAVDDNSGGNYQPCIEFDCITGGTYYLRVAYGGNDYKGKDVTSTGDYRLIIQETVNPPDLNSPENHAIAEGYTVQFTWDESFGATQYMIEVAFDPFFNTQFTIPDPYTYDTNIAVSGFDDDGTPYY